MELLLALAGATAGLLAMALPGAHVNGLALATLALWPHPAAAPFLIGALAGAPFGTALSSTLFGASDESEFPAHALAREGRAAEAIALQAWGAFGGLAIGILLASLAWPILRVAAPHLLAAMPWILLGVLALLILTEPARPRVHPALVAAPWGVVHARGTVERAGGDAWRIGGRLIHDPHGLIQEGDTKIRAERAWRRGPLSMPAGWLLAACALALSGALGIVALRMGARSPLGLPASALLPLLAGLFAAPALVEAARKSGRTPRARLRAAPPLRGEYFRAVAPAAAASSLLGIAPGVAPSHVALLARRPRGAESGLLSLGAVAGGAVAFTLLAWHALGKARAGALVAAQATRNPAPGIDGFLLDAAIVVGAAGAACLLARALSAPASRALASVGSRRLAVVGIALLVASVAATTGAWGLAVFAVAGGVGEAIARTGVRRGLAMGAILVPVVLRAFGLA